MSNPEVIETETVRLIFDGAKCVHSRHCVLSRPDVFVPNVQGAWLHPELASADEIAELAHNCPSGAIRYERLDGGKPEQAPRVNLIRILENGPLAVHAELHLAQGETISDDVILRATLCRCGASKNKPFCDGSHANMGFTATGEPNIKDSTALETRNGALKLTPLPNGPLKFNGPVELISGTGHTINRVTKTTLCRCGHSQNKPYCDGSHVAAGFTTE